MMREKIESNMRQEVYRIRSIFIYYTYVIQLLRGFACNAKSIIDIGSSDTPILEELDWIPNKYCLDKEYVYRSKNVIGIEVDFLEFMPKEKYDFCICLQVLEHIPDAKAFAQKLFNISDHVLISVPYKWESGSVKGHVHDPVNEKKLYKWTGRKPRYQIIVTEPFTYLQRIICYYSPKGLNISLNEVRQIAHSRRLQNIKSNSYSWLEDC